METTTLQAAFVFFALIGGPLLCAGLMLLPKRWISLIDKKLGIQ